jgi:hypothetical protein
MQSTDISVRAREVLETFLRSCEHSGGTASYQVLELGDRKEIVATCVLKKRGVRLTAIERESEKTIDRDEILLYLSNKSTIRIVVPQSAELKIRDSVNALRVIRDSTRDSIYIKALPIPVKTIKMTIVDSGDVKEIELMFA